MAFVLREVGYFDDEEIATQCLANSYIELICDKEQYESLLRQLCSCLIFVIHHVL